LATIGILLEFGGHKHPM